MLTRLLRSHLKPYGWSLLAIVVLQFVSTLAALYLPSLNADIIDSGVARGDTDYILRVGGWMLLVSLVQAATSVGALYFGSRTAMAVGRDLRADIYDQVARFSSQEVNRFGAPSLLTRTTNDVQQIQQLLAMGFAMLVMAPMMAIGGIQAWRTGVGVAPRRRHTGSGRRGARDHLPDDPRLPAHAGEGRPINQSFGSRSPGSG